MERLTQRRLGSAEKLVAEGAAHVARQKRLIEQLDHAGHSAASARALLKEFEHTQARHIADFERLSRELTRATGR